MGVAVGCAMGGAMGVAIRDDPTLLFVLVKLGNPNTNTSTKNGRGTSLIRNSPPP